MDNSKSPDLCILGVMPMTTLPRWLGHFFDGAGIHPSRLPHTVVFRAIQTLR